MPAEPSPRQVVNLRDVAVELHLGETTVVLGPHEATELPRLDDLQRAQLDELVRRHDLALRSPATEPKPAPKPASASTPAAPAPKKPATRTRKPRGS